MKIVHVIVGLARTAGTTVFVREFAREQLTQGHEVKIVYQTRNEIDTGSVPTLKIRYLDDLGYIPDVVHIHAVWSMFQVRAMEWCWKSHVKYIVSVHGCLMPRVMNKGWLKKHIFYWLFLKKNLQNAAAIHCTGEGERDVVEALGLKPPKVIAPLGCHLPQVEEVTVRGEGEQRNILFLGRLGEEKGLMFLLDAWKAINRKNCKLIIAGPSWLGYGEKLKNKVEVEKIGGVEFTGNADEVMKDKLYRAADLFILPSPMENFSMVVLDALAYGVPVICTKGTPWKIIEEQKAGWWIKPNSSAAILAALEEALDLTDGERRLMGDRGRKIAELYSWSQIAGRIVY